MEYPSINDFFLRFEPIFNSDGEFTDYILVDVSDNFQRAVNMDARSLLGKRISNIVVDKNNTFGLNDFYYFMIPDTRRKFKAYIDELNRHYIITIFSDNMNYLVIFYNDISNIKEGRFAEDADKYYRDKLTGLYNKNFFEEELKRLDTKRQLPISIIMGDLNGLKLINDAFGHEMGDRALKFVANNMKESFRKEDIVSRTGGDEYMALLPRTDTKTAEVIVKRLKNKINSTPLEFIKLSMSFGIATKEDSSQDINEVIRKAEERMYHYKLQESKIAKMETINYLRKTLKETTFEDEGHYERLESLSLKIANKLDISDMEKEELKLLCDFHDIGNIGIPKEILYKKDKLSQEEWDQIKRHIEIGYHIVKQAKEKMAVDELILMHHEWWNGKGYPGSLKGEKIPIVIRIFSIADAYESMTNDRPNREKMSKEEAIQEINSMAGIQFDPRVVGIFNEVMEINHIMEENNNSLHII